MATRFKIVFHPGSAKEYRKLSNPVLTYVNNSLRELAERADEIGKRLGNTKYTHLAGCKEIKLRDCGYRIIFRVTDRKAGILTIVLIASIGERDELQVFLQAASRLKNIDLIKKIIEDAENTSQTDEK